MAAACSPPVSVVLPGSGPTELPTGHVTAPVTVASGAATAPRLASPARVGPTPASAPRLGQHPNLSPYAAAARGYDASYPQCGVAAPAGAAFAVIGVNAGKGFTRDACLRELWRAAAPIHRRDVYLNSGYNPDNARFVGGECRARARQAGGSDVERTAYAIGCQEAAHSLTVMSQEGVSRPAVCWVDVERVNSWDERDVGLNRFALEGEFDALADAGCAVGVYSTYSEWEEITGNWVTPRVAGDWVALARPDEACAGRGFTGAPVWLVQEIATWPDAEYDSDWAC